MSNYQAQHSGSHESDRRGRAGWSRRTKILSAILGAMLAGGVAYAATDWVVGLTGGSSGQAKSASIANLTITAVAAPSPSTLLYPGGTGDVVAQITNPNPFPVTITGVNLPTNTTYAGGYGDSGLSTPQTGCTSSTSAVSWSFATTSSGSAHTLTAPITVAGAGQTTITFTGAASMGLSSPAACVSSYFSMPSLTGVAASGGAAATTSATTDSWTS